MSENRVYSFDVFDTCLTRNILRPSDLYYLMGERLLERFKSLPDREGDILKFVELRRQAETQARNLSENEDISLQLIYGQFNSRKFYDIPVEEIFNTELQMEEEVVRPIAKTKFFIDALRRRGQKIIFISDMYMPTEAVRSLLIKYGYAAKEDSVYVSGDIGLTKASGSLFTHVLKEEKLHTSEIYHYGDHPKNDVATPRQMGIRAERFEDSQRNRYEEKHYRVQHEIPSKSSRLLGACRAARLMSDDQSYYGKEHAQIAANIVAPFLISFVVWVLKDVWKKKIKRLYFVSRDGQIFYKIAQRLARYMPIPECRYLYGSRQAWYLPSVTGLEREDLDWLFIEEQSRAPVHLLKKLEIQPHEISAILEDFGYDNEWCHRQLVESNEEEFWKVLEHPEVVSLVKEKADQKRGIALKYFSQEGLFSQRKEWAVMDIGWTLKCQRSLKRMFESQGTNVNVRGYYLALLKDRVSEHEAGPSRAFFDQTYSNASSETESFFNYLTLIEQVLTIADHGQVVHYQDNGSQVVPVLVKQPNHEAKEQFVRTLHQSIVTCTDEMVKAGLLNSDSKELRAIALDNFVTFLKSPTYEEADSIASIPLGDDQNESRIFLMARAIKMGDLIHMVLHGRRLGTPSDRQFAWIEGSLVLSPFYIRWFFYVVISPRKMLPKKIREVYHHFTGLCASVFNHITRRLGFK